MRHQDGRITCEECERDITDHHIMCDGLNGEWCDACFGECIRTEKTGEKCCGEGCPTVCVGDER